MTHLLCVNVGLNDLNVLVESRSITEMQDPVESCTQQNDHISLFQSKWSGRTYIQRMWIRHYSLSHWGWQEWYFDFFDEFSNLFFSSSVGSPFSDDYQGFLCKTNDIDGLSDLRWRWTESCRLGKDWDFDIPFDHFVEDVSRDVKKNRSWSACCG